jgi:UDP-N-acetylglucosamine 2-epimerase (non-hydrolysing)
LSTVSDTPSHRTAPAGGAKPTVDLVAGARPNFMKLAPVVRAIAGADEIGFRIVHTGQHYDPAMNDVFFEELQIPPPDVHLGVGSGGHGAQTARILERYEAELLRHRPAATVVFGDVNSTLACALAAVKLGVPVAHVEAGLRSNDRSMPEEINRLVTDAVADLLLTTEASALSNLRREGVAEEKVRFVGNVMIDTLLRNLPAARARQTARRLGVEGDYGLVTLHRPVNVDDPATASRLLSLLAELAGRLPLVFPVHPRTRESTRRAGAERLLTVDPRRLLCLEPQPYLDTLSLLAGAKVVLTDSGGLQEESSALRVPCLTLRETTERPCTVELGTSRLVGSDSEKIRAAFGLVFDGSWPKGSDIPLWDGQAGMRVAAALAAWLRAAAPVSPRS